MVNERQVYLLDPQQLSPEIIAVTFAKTSRSPESFREIAADLSQAKSSEFNEKWVVGYGHSSVAEHAVLHIAVENISRLATECLESNRLASYTEKSTRYQTWNADAFYIPAELDNPPLRLEYLNTCQTLLETYQRMIPRVSEAITTKNVKKDEESNSTWERHIRSLTIDVCRFLLPSCVLANVGMTINARALEHALTKMLSHPLSEVRSIGSEIKRIAMQSVPTLLKYADADETLEQIAAAFSLPISGVGIPDENWCQLVHFDPDAEDRILAAGLYHYQNIDYTQALIWIKQTSLDERKKLVQAITENKKRHSQPMRELEHAMFTFDVVLDQGAYYEVKRHRMMTLTPQSLTTNLGYAIPKAIEDAGALNDYTAAMDLARATYQKLVKETPAAASYVVPNAFNRRFLISANLRSLSHFINLRSAPNAHFSIRRLAQQMTSELSGVLPSFAPYLRCFSEETADSIESEFFVKPQECEL